MKSNWFQRYLTFFQELLSPGWILFEVSYILLMLIVLAVIGATAGTMLQDGTGLPYAVRMVDMMAAVGLFLDRDIEWIDLMWRDPSTIGNRLHWGEQGF